MGQGIFITGIGTDIGKTFVACALLYQMHRAHIQAEAIKPLASGVIMGDAYSDPARLLKAMGRPHHPSAIQDICPWHYEAAVAPHVAAKEIEETIPWQELVAFCQQKIEPAEMMLVEGAGGVMSPVNETKLVIDLIAKLRIPALLVASDYLGSISHTLTALDALKSSRVPLLGIIVCESTDPAMEQHDFQQVIWNRQWDHLPLVWIPRRSEAPDAYKFVPSLEMIWNNHPSFSKN